MDITKLRTVDVHIARNPSLCVVCDGAMRCTAGSLACFKRSSDHALHIMNKNAVSHAFIWQV
jgi:hypothetical protein